MTNIIEFGVLKIKREKLFNGCVHKRLQYDPRERIIECIDCKRPIDSFDAFLKLVENFERRTEQLNFQINKILELKEKGLSLIAAKKVEEAWRSRSMVPTCPHCNEAIFANDGFGISNTNKQMALERRKFKEKK